MPEVTVQVMRLITPRSTTPLIRSFVGCLPKTFFEVFTTQSQWDTRCTTRTVGAVRKSAPRIPQEDRKNPTLGPTSYRVLAEAFV
jgi:hypothetical protein